MQPRIYVPTRQRRPRGPQGKAVKWYRKAAEQGNALAQSNLGWMYHHGKGVPEDHKESVKWYRKAEQGNALAQLECTPLRRRPRGPRGSRQVVAAEQGNALAQSDICTYTAWASPMTM